MKSYLAAADSEIIRTAIFNYFWSEVKVEGRIQYEYDFPRMGIIRYLNYTVSISVDGRFWAGMETPGSYTELEKDTTYLIALLNELGYGDIQ